MSNNKQETIRSPIGRARGLGTAHHGVHHWWMQRVSSVALIPLSAFFLFNLKHLINPNYMELITFLGQPHVTIALILFIITAFYHAMLGIQVIVEDYIHHKGAKVVILAFNQLFFLALGIAALYAVITIGFNWADYASARAE